MTPPHLKTRSARPRPAPRRMRVGVFPLGGIILALAIAFGGLSLWPGSPLPAEWQPLAPLEIGQPPGPYLTWKLARATGTGARCTAVLSSGGIIAQTRPDRLDSDQCHIRDHVGLQRLQTARVSPVSTRCGTALRLALWEAKTLQPAALASFGVGVAEIHHFDSYSCRPIRTPSGNGGRMSAHATADAIDIRGVTLEDGRRLSLLTGWNGTAEEAAFWRVARDGACTWFRTVLSPDYNSLHANHFHFAQGRWPSCR